MNKAISQDEALARETVLQVLREGRGRDEEAHSGFARARGDIVTWLNSDDVYVLTDVVSAEHKAPGVLVIPEWWGLTDYPKGRAEQLARLGYVAFVADIYGAGVTTTDAKKTFASLKAKGVDITQEPNEQPYGTDFGIRDPFGNHIRIVQLAPNAVQAGSKKERAK